MKKNKLKYNIVLFSVVFILFFIKTKLTGNFGRISYGPISYKETIDKIPEMLVFSAIILIIINISNKEVVKSEEKNIEAARKRIEEREKTKHEETEHEEKGTQDNPERKEVENNK